MAKGINLRDSTPFYSGLKVIEHPLMQGRKLLADKERGKIYTGDIYWMVFVVCAGSEKTQAIEKATDISIEIAKTKIAEHIDMMIKKREGLYQLNKIWEKTQK